MLWIVLVRGYEDDFVVFILVIDIVCVVCYVIEYDGKWFEIGGIMGDWFSVRDM